jgi:integrator complex subunit 11
MNLMETVKVKDMSIKAYYAGHVLGACMFLIEYKGIKVLYTGDFNSNADRHLGAAWVDKIKPNLIITECTYATIIRDSKRSRESEFLK